MTDYTGKGVMLMTKMITDAVCRRLAEEFGEGYRIYKGAVPQGLSAPAFIIGCSPPEIRQFLNNRYLMTYHVSVRFIPRPDEPADDTAERLFFALEYISVEDGIVHGTGIECEAKEGGLYLSADYGVFAYRQDNPDLMEDLVVEGGVSAGNA